MLLNVEDFKYAMTERNSKNKLKANCELWQHKTCHYQINTNPTSNCQMAIFGGINGVIGLSQTREELIANMKTICKLAKKNILMVDFKDGQIYRNGVLTSTYNLFKDILGDTFIMDTPYISTNKSNMRTILLKTSLIKELQ